MALSMFRILLLIVIDNADAMPYYGNAAEGISMSAIMNMTIANLLSWTCASLANDMWRCAHSSIH